MAERQVSVEFAFDRSADRELVEAYRMLVPERRAHTVWRRDGDDHSQAFRADPESTSRLGPVADTGEAQHRSALGA